MLSAAFVLSSMACGSSDDDFMEKSVVMMEGLASSIESAGGDCGKMATSVEAFVTKNEGAMKQIKAKAEELKKDKAKAEQLKKSADKFKDRLGKAMPAVMGMLKCADDPKMKAVEARLKSLM